MIRVSSSSPSARERERGRVASGELRYQTREGISFYFFFRSKFTISKPKLVRSDDISDGISVDLKVRKRVLVKAYPFNKKI